MLNLPAHRFRVWQFLSAIAITVFDRQDQNLQGQMCTLGNRVNTLSSFPWNAGEETGRGFLHLMLIIYEILWLTAGQLESFQAVNIHFLSKHIKRRRLQFIWEWVVTKFQIGNLEKSLMVVNTLDGSSFFRFIFILRLFFFSARDQTQSLCMLGEWSTLTYIPRPTFLHFLPPQKWLQPHSCVEPPLQFQTLPRPLGFTELQSGVHNPQREPCVVCIGKGLSPLINQSSCWIPSAQWQ